MPRYLVQVSQPEAIAAKRISDSVRSIGSHFATHADWQRQAGRCTGSMVIEAADSWGALASSLRACGLTHVSSISKQWCQVANKPDTPHSDKQPYAVAA